jgi:hypothetical protein
MAQVGASKIGLRALSYAEAFVGVKEQPSGTNHGPSVWRNLDKRGNKVKGGIDFWCERANGVAGGYPWCSAFATYCFEWAGRKIGDARRASVGFFEEWGGQHGYVVKRPFRGDLVCYRFDSDNWPDHIGIVQKVLALPGGGKPFLIRTVEGNTSMTSNDNGGKVMVRTRLAYRCRFVRIPDGEI